MNGGTKLRTRVAAACFAACGLIAVAGQADAAVGGAEAIAVSPSTVEGGAQITITGTGWLCPADVDVYIVDGAPTLIQTIAFGDITDGGFSLVTAAPNAVGDYDVIARYGAPQSSSACEGEANDPFTVVAETTTTTATTTTTTTTIPDSGGPTTTTTIPGSTGGTTTTTTPASGGGTTTTTTTIVGNQGPTTTQASSANPTTTLSAGPVSTLPVTGGSSTTLAPYALIVLAGGVVLVMLARRSMS